MLTNPRYLARLRDKLAQVREDREETIVIRRGNATLAAQSARVEQGWFSERREREETAATKAQITVLMAVGADVQVDDRFNDADGNLFVVTAVRPNGLAATICQATMVE
jgi:hypothetical protein